MVYVLIWGSFACLGLRSLGFDFGILGFGFEGMVFWLSFCLNVLGCIRMYICVCSLQGLAFDFDLWVETILKLFLAFGIHGFLN